MAHESPRVGDKKGGREASGVAENPWGYRQGVGGRVELPQGTDTPGVAELPRWDKTPGVTTKGEGEPREDGWGRVGDEKKPHHPSNRGARSRRRQQQADGRTKDGAAAAPIAGHGGRQQKRWDPDKAYHRHGRRQAQSRRASAPQVRLTGTNGEGG